MEHYWQFIRDLAQRDESVEPPAASVSKAMEIFQPVLHREKVFRLQPAYAGMVRRAEPPRKLVFELGEQFVQVEQYSDGQGVNLSGFVSGLEDTAVTLFGDESVFQTPVRDGEFEFKSLPAGCYDMAFDCKGESLWIPKLILGESQG